MRFLMAVLDDSKSVDGPEVMPAIDAFNEKLREAGYWIFAWGLESPSRAKVFDNRGGAGIVSQAPYIPYQEGDLHMAGLWIVDVPSQEVAEGLAAEGSKACNRKVELRPFH